MPKLPAPPAKNEQLCWFFVIIIGASTSISSNFSRLSVTNKVNICSTKSREFCRSHFLIIPQGRSVNYR